MEKECFEDEEIAELLNKNFISIKVDREERPDIDSIYMTFCQAYTGSGGWPLTVIMTSEKKPFFLGTYFPKKSRYGIPGLEEILNSLLEEWINNKDKILESSNVVLEEIKKFDVLHKKDSIDKEVIEDAIKMLKHSFDRVYGGFSKQPKFPTPHNLYFLLRYYYITKDKNILQMVENTLKCMYKGGIFDHIGFGFSRYSTDNKWLVPHFEKMLYDNALLALAYTEAYKVSNNKLYKEVAEKIFTYVLRDMLSPEGGFYSAEDADSEGVEGKFYVFTVDEIEGVLGKEDGSKFCSVYGIIKGGNFEGKNIPNLIDTNINDIENNEELYNSLNSMREKLFEYRNKRIHPHKDDKILTSWNGLMIAALAYAGRCFNNIEYVKAAEKAFNFIFNKLMRSDGRLLARYRDGDAANAGFLDDYAFLIWGLIELYETTFEVEYLKKALNMNKDMLKYFQDEKDGGLFLYGSDSEQLIIRPKEIYDGALPSGNSVAALNMLRLSKLTGNRGLEDIVQNQFNAFGGTVKKNPMAYTNFITAFIYSTTAIKEITIVGERKADNVEKMIKEVNNTYLPFSTVILNDGNDDLFSVVPFARSQDKVNNKSTAYVCEGFSCNEPTVELNKLSEMLKQSK